MKASRSRDEPYRQRSAPAAQPRTSPKIQARLEKQGVDSGIDCSEKKKKNNNNSAGPRGRERFADADGISQKAAAAATTVDACDKEPT